MQSVALLCLLAVAAAVPLPDDPGAVSETEYPDSVKELLSAELDDQPKKARRIFRTGTSAGTKRKLRRGPKEERSENGVKETGASVSEGNKDAKGGATIGQEDGWRPTGVQRLQKLQRARSLAKSDDKTADLSTDASEKSDDSSIEGEGDDAEENEVEDREAENSYLSPLFAPAPGGLGGGYGGYGGGYGGYGGSGPYIYILPIVLPQPGRHHGGAARSLVTETGHESHHYSGGPTALPSGGHGEYRPIYAGSHSVPPIYIPKEYGHSGHVTHGGHRVHGGHGGHGGPTTVHHEEAIIRDIDPPIFKV